VTPSRQPQGKPTVDGLSPSEAALASKVRRLTLSLGGLFGVGGFQVMAENCNSAPDLVALEATLRAAMTQWTHAEPLLGTPPLPPPHVPHRSSSAVAC